MRGFHPHRLAPRQLSHLLDVREEELSLLRPILRCEHILLPRLPEQTLDLDLARRQALRPRPLVPVFLADPPAVHEHRRRAAVARERRHDHVPVVAVEHARADEHLLVVAEVAAGDDAAVVEVVNRGGVDVRREGEGVADEAVFEFGDELGLPAEALDLPGAEDEGGDGDDGWGRDG